MNLLHFNNGKLIVNGIYITENHISRSFFDGKDEDVPSVTVWEHRGGVFWETYYYSSTIVKIYKLPEDYDVKVGDVFCK